MSFCPELVQLINNQHVSMVNASIAQRLTPKQQQEFISEIVYLGPKHLTRLVENVLKNGEKETEKINLRIVLN